MRAKSFYTIVFLSALASLFSQEARAQRVQVIGDPIDAYKLRVNSDGSINVNNGITVTATVTNFPSGPATSLNQTTQISALSNIITNTASNATSLNQSTQIQALSSLITNTAINAAGSIVNGTCVTTSATTFSPPANATGFIFESESTNSAPVRWAVGGTASSSVGNYYEAGRDSVYVPVAAAISCFATSGTQSVDIQWLQKQ